jgi:uncharacterized HhH-GPD family protein
MGLDLRLTDDPDADRLLSENPLALLLGMLLDQQVAMEWAFSAPLKLAERLDGPLDAATIAALDPEQVEALFTAKPALHRYPGSMARRAHTLCQFIVDEYGGDTAAIWNDVADGKELLRRLKALPGFGDQKARIFLALLGKQCGVTPEGWREAAGDYGQDGHRSIADVTSPDALALVREYKQAGKVAAKQAKR